MSATEVTDATIESEVLQSDLPVLVDFWAPWCGPCKQVGPIVDALAKKYAGRVKVVKVNVDQAPASAQAFRVQSIPTLMLIHEQRLVDRITGAADQATIEAMLQKVAGSAPAGPERWDVERAKLALEAELAVPLDCREAGPFRSAHIPGAVNAPPVESGDRFAHVAPSSDRFLLYARTDEGVDQLAEEAEAAGLRVAILEGGMIAWELAGGRVKKGIPPA